VTRLKRLRWEVRTEPQTSDASTVGARESAGLGDVVLWNASSYDFLRCVLSTCIDCYKRFYSRPQPIDVQQQESHLIADRPKQLRDQPSLEPKIPMNFRQVERRVFSRLSCQIPARIVVGSGSFIAGVVSGISLNGCFIETPNTVPIGSEIELSLELKEETRSRALIRTSLPAAGLGVEFTLMTTPNFRRLQSILKNSVRLDSNF